MLAGLHVSRYFHFPNFQNFTFFNNDHIWSRRKLCPNPLAQLFYLQCSGLSGSGICWAVAWYCSFCWQVTSFNILYFNILFSPGDTLSLHNSISMGLTCSVTNSYKGNFLSAINLGVSRYNKDIHIFLEENDFQHVLPLWPSCFPRGPFYWCGLTLISAWINNHIPSEV